MTAVESLPSDTLTRDLLVQVLAAMVRHDLDNSAGDQESLDSETRPAATDASQAANSLERR